jgi:hypothetical protein
MDCFPQFALRFFPAGLSFNQAQKNGFLAVVLILEGSVK